MRRPIAQLWDKKAVKIGPLRPICSRRFPSPTGCQGSGRFQQTAFGSQPPEMMVDIAELRVDRGQALRVPGAALKLPPVLAMRSISGAGARLASPVSAA